MRRLQAKIKAGVLPSGVELGQFLFLSLALLLFASVLWAVAVVGRQFQ